MVGFLMKKRRKSNNSAGLHLPPFPKGEKGGFHYIIFPCFLLSGFLGLVYEIIWIRKLGLIFGNTIFAITTVLAVFFGGLAIGSFIFGRFSRYTNNPIKVYAILELAIGIFAFLFPSLLKFFGWFYGSFYNYIYQNFFALTLIRFILFSILLIFPTTMMGGTLPMLSKYFIHHKESIGSKIGVLYAINTFGATLGAFISGFYFIRTIGVDSTNYMAGTLNIIIALIAYLLGRKIAPSSSINIAKLRESIRIIHDENIKLKLSGIPICFFLSGFASIGYEIVWTRYLSLPLANTRYTYTIILTVFLLGTTLGSIIFTPLFDKIKNASRFFGYLEIGIGFFSFILVPVVYFLTIRFKYSLLLNDFIVCSVLMLIPTTLMGATFPTVVKILTSDTNLIGYSTGKLYAINTFGNITGSIMTGFLILPALGIKASLVILVLINIFIGVYCLVRYGKNWTFNGVSLFLLIVAFVIVNISINVKIPDDFLKLLKKPEEKITLIKEGLESTIWITENQQNGQKSLWANQTVLGRTLANEPYKVSPQIIAGHIPMLLHSGSPQNILGICLGTGQTFGSILSYDIKKMDLVEISKTITDIAIKEFRDYNGDLGNSDKTRIIIEDGRNFVAHIKENYDIITLEPSPPEEAGIVNLYTKEFYQQCKSKLNQDGIMSQWLPIYNTHPDETSRIIKTFISVFPDSILWYNTADLMLLGFNGKIHLDESKISSLLQKDKISKDLNISYPGNENRLNDTDSFFACLLMGPEELKKISSSASLITDNHPDLEYTFLKYESLENRPEWLEIYNAEIIREFLVPVRVFLPFMHEDRLINVENIRAKYISHLFADAYNRLAVARANKDLNEAIALCKKALEFNPEFGIVYANLGIYYSGQGKSLEAINAYQKAIVFLPENAQLWYYLGRAYWSVNDKEKAIESWQKAVKVDPNFSYAYNDIGVAYASLFKYQDAISAYKKAIKYNPKDANIYYNLGLAYEAIGQWADAISMYKEALKIEPDFNEALVRLREIAR